MASNLHRSTANPQTTRVRQYVDGQLERTRQQVRTNDLISALLAWAAGVATFFLVAAVIDAWIIPLSVTMRWISLAALITGTLAWLAFAILPLLRRRINADYAAQMIEQAEPGFKNSVLNYVFLRRKDDDMNVAVMDAVTRQAAKKLHAIPDDATVDRSTVIRIGFILVGLMLFAVTYKLVSPRDPLLTVRRILFPSDQIAKPASVQIADVQPGNTNVFFGDSLEVTATVRGPHDPAGVRMLVSTADGQIVDRPIVMTADESGRGYAALLQLSDAGIQQSLRYRIVAGDGETPEFRATVRANPAITIESIDLTAPAYTGLPVRTLTGRGDIEAVEGTEAMIRAVANLPIEVAYIELLNEIPDPNATTPDATRMKAAAPPIQMRLVSENQATGRFSLSLNSRRTKPIATHYQVRFVSKSGDRNETPNVYPIRITPDLAPEIKIVTPRSRESSLAVNDRLPIEIWASDLDFAIASVTLNMDHQGSGLLRQALPLESDTGNQRVTARLAFEPSRYGLQPGDQVVFHAVAADNRVSIRSLEPDPNLTQSDNFTITIDEANPQAQQRHEQPPTDEPNENSDQRSEDQANEQPQAAADEANNQSDHDGERSDAAADSDEPGDSMDEGGTGEQPSEARGDQEQQPEQTDSSEASNDQNDQSQGGSESQAPGDQNQQRSPEQNGGAQDDSSGGSEGSGGPESAGGEGGDESSSDESGGGTPSDSDPPGNAQTKQDDPNARGADRPNDSPAQGSDSADGANGTNSNNGGDPNAPETRDSNLKNGNQERLSKDAHEGEQFEKLEELLKDQPPTNNDSPSRQSNPPPGTDQPQPQQDAGSNAQQPAQGGGNNQNQPPGAGGSQSNPDGQPSSNGQSSDGNKTDGNQQNGSPQNGSGQPGNGAGSGSQNSDGQPSDAQPSNSTSGDPSAGGGGDPGNPSENGTSTDQPSDGDQPAGSGSGSGGSGGASSQTPDGSDPNQKTIPGDNVGAGSGGSQTSNEQLQKEKANLDHAKKATDLVLNKLEDQQYEPDPELLEKMNWTKQDLRDFLKRWKQMKAASASGDDNAKRRYERAVKSLGLRPDSDLRTSKNRDADAGGLNQDGSVIQPPADLAQEFNQFLRDRNRVK